MRYRTILIVGAITDLILIFLSMLLAPFGYGLIGVALAMGIPVLIFWYKSRLTPFQETFTVWGYLGIFILLPYVFISMFILNTEPDIIEIVFFPFRTNPMQLILFFSLSYLIHYVFFGYLGRDDQD